MEQNFDNHVEMPKKLLRGMLTLLVSVILAGVSLGFAATKLGIILIGAAVILGGIGGISTLIVTRGYCTRLQDRIIRTEMQLRLRAVLPEDMQTAVSSLTLRQLIGLRFAGDEELPDLVRKTLDESLKEKAIKSLVKDWQGDHLRV